MNYNIDTFISLINGKLLSKAEEFNVKYIHIDSRTINNPLESIFFTITGGNNDGHDYINDVFNCGVRNFVIESEEKFSKLGEEIKNLSNIIVVRNCIDALQDLASFHRAQFKMPIIGIAGSNGKTIIKEWLYQLLYKDKSIHRSPKSYNSQVGVPLSVIGLNEEHELGIFEAGISTTAEMEKLEKIIDPGIGIFTNIGPPHQEGFVSSVEKIKEKLKLFKNSDILIYCRDHDDVHAEIIKQKNINFKPGLKLYSWSENYKEGLYIKSIDKRSQSTVISGIYEHKSISIKIPFVDDASIENTIHCWLLLLFMGYDQSYIKEKMQDLSPVEMRLELKEGINNCTLINDTYNSDLNSLSIALDYLCQQNQHKNKTLIISDILQSGLNESDLYREVANILKNKGVKRVIGIGREIMKNSTFFDIESSFYKATEDFLQNLNNESFSNEAILVKGARVFSFEKITSALQRKVHDTILELNLHSLVHNLNIYRSFLKPETKIMAMVKAFSYGSGSYEIANILQYHNVDYLAVAYADEGVELRKSGITLPIMVMNPEKESFPVIFSTDLEPEIYSLSLLNKLIRYKTDYRKGHKVFIHIKIDTGMNRLGFVAEDIPELIKILTNNNDIIVKSVFSHLSSSENIEHDDFTSLQINNFKLISDRIIESLNYTVMKHLLNSAGTLRFQNAHFDMVRLGIGLYGFDASDTINDRLENVSTLKTTISQVKHVKKGQPVGYSLEGVLKRDSQIAIIGVGYADGFPRTLGNGKGFVVIDGKEAPTVGNICMDMTMINITGLNVKEGDEVIVFGKELPIQKLADELGTIPYEVLTNISARVKRIYYKE